ncbi:hypothetical protein RHMOL_Rhmol04G0124700 [Rhododendron molle]|uniref:Uncharacterized protein n=1 Tax=Rhododendron molle TaxID=49168 RepID=A0ACC0NZJ4_RHOML|nr:hypothetical protein RHMOL_Rhmol04G0124700 [Rhododendron molle]
MWGGGRNRWGDWRWVPNAVVVPGSEDPTVAMSLVESMAAGEEIPHNLDTHRFLRTIRGNGVGCEGGFVPLIVGGEDGGLGVVVEGVEGGDEGGADAGGDEGLGDLVGDEVELLMPEKKRVWVKRMAWGRERSGGGWRYPNVVD